MYRATTYSLRKRSRHAIPQLAKRSISRSVPVATAATIRCTKHCLELGSIFQSTTLQSTQSRTLPQANFSEELLQPTRAATTLSSGRFTMPLELFLTAHTPTLQSTQL